MEPAAPQRARILPLRLKLFVVVVGTLVATMVSFLVLAIRLFEDDKQAYVYDASASLVEAVATETESLVGGALAAMRLAAATVVPGETGPKLVADVMAGNAELAALSVIRPGAGAIRGTQPAFLELFDLRAEELHARADELAARVGEDVRIESAILPGGVPVLGMVARLPGPDGGPVVVVGQVRHDRLLKTFQRASLSTVFLVDGRGRVLVHPDATQVAAGADVADPAFAEHVLASPFRAGTKELEGPGGERWLTAYAKIGAAGGLVVVARTARDRAFEASRKLVAKSVLFAVALVLASILVSFLFTRTLTRPINRLFEATKRIATGDFTVRVASTTSDEIGVLTTSFNGMAGRIVTLMDEVRDKARMESELETARLVQENLFPKDRAESPAYELAGYYKPASECGGDWWGYFTVDGQLFVMIGDATGHGIPAALITAAAQSCATTLQQFKQVHGHELEPAVIMDYLNRAIFHAANRNMNMTFFVAKLDLASGRLTYCNASHEMPAQITREDGAPTIVPLMGDPDPCLGDSLEHAFHEHELQLNPGDTLVWYTDGLTEARNGEDAEWGERRFFKALKAKDEASAAELCESLLEVNTAFRGTTPADDDITFIVVKWRGEAGALERAG